MHGDDSRGPDKSSMRRIELPALTGIRFYAALFVFLSHVPLVPGMQTLAGGSLVFNAGVVGVSFFFVLSGFILTYNYADTFRRGVSAAAYKRFVWDRFTKIYPVHIAMLVFVLPIAINSPTMRLDWRAVPVHALLLQCFWPWPSGFGASLNVPSWSISCEWFFYLLAPFAIFLVLGRLHWRFLVVATIATYAVVIGLALSDGSEYARLNTVSWFAPSRFPEFIAGVFLARFYLSHRTRDSAVVAGLMQAAGVALIAAGALYRASAPWPFWGGLLYVPGSVLLVLGLAYGQGLLARHLSGPVLHRLGTASFSLYLMHAPMLRALKGVFYFQGWEITSWAGFGVVTVVMLIVVQTAAIVVCFRYEIPVQRWLRRLLPVHQPAAEMHVATARL